MAAAFISYKRENLAKVQLLVQALRGGGVEVWWDQDIAPDAPWEATIERELAAAKVAVVAWSTFEIGPTPTYRAGVAFTRAIPDPA